MSAAPADLTSADEAAIRELYQHVLAGWNSRNPGAYATPFAEDGEVVGFDGSDMAGRATIAATLAQIFADHQTGAYVGKVRTVRPLGPDAALLRAVGGMVLPGQSDLEPKLNTLHTLVAVKQDGTWRIALFQNTPAQLHGRPELVQELTAELRQLLG